MILCWTSHYSNRIHLMLQHKWSTQLFWTMFVGTPEVFVECPWLLHLTTPPCCLSVSSTTQWRWTHCGGARKSLSCSKWTRVESLVEFVPSVEHAHVGHPSWTWPHQHLWTPSHNVSRVQLVYQAKMRTHHHHCLIGKRQGVLWGEVCPCRPWLRECRKTPSHTTWLPVDGASWGLSDSCVSLCG